MDWSNPVSSAISGLFGLLGNKLNYDYNTRLAAQQNQYNIDMWKMQNDYNSPAAQMRRFEEAGLNPALMVGQISSGNASHAPEQVTPAAPDYSKNLSELAKAFNIEGLRTAIAQRKQAEADARSKSAAADAAEGENAYYEDIGRHYKVNDRGQLVLRDLADSYTVHVRPADAIAAGRVVHALEQNFRTNSLLYPRGQLIGSQRLLNLQRQNLLAPQISMANYLAKYYPYQFWIGNVKSGLQGIAPFISPFF